MGVQFISPVKKRASKKKAKRVSSFVLDAKRTAMEEKMKALQESMARCRERALRIPDSGPAAAHEKDETEEDQACAEGSQMDVDAPECNFGGDDEPEPAPKPKRLAPDDTANKLYDTWLQVLPTLVAPYLEFLGRTLRNPWDQPKCQLSAQCRQPPGACSRSLHQVQGLLFGCNCFSNSCESSFR